MEAFLVRRGFLGLVALFLALTGSYVFWIEKNHSCSSSSDSGSPISRPRRSGTSSVVLVVSVVCANLLDDGIAEALRPTGRRWRMFRRALLLPPLVVALAACGGGSGLTKAQYDAKVNRLCLLAADQMRELHMGASLSAWRHSGPTVVRVAEHFDKSLAALKAPGDIAADAADFLKANEKLAKDYKAAVAAANDGNSAKLRAAGSRSTKDGAATFPAAKAIGATGCYIG